MIDAFALAEVHQYPHTAKYYEGNVADDTVDALLKLNEYELRDEDESAKEIFDLLAQEDELCEIYDGLFDALEMSKDDMIEQIKSTLAQLEDKNNYFCNRQTLAASLLQKEVDCD